VSVDNIFVFVVIFSELLVRTTPAGGTEQARDDQVLKERFSDDERRIIDADDLASIDLD
jgi:hypothetical protein